MPCYTIQTASVNLNHADLDLLEKALQKEGYSVYRSSGTKTLNFQKGGVSGSYRNDKLEFKYSGSTNTPDTDAIKRAYSKEVILRKADDYAEQGFEMEQDGDEYVFRKTVGYGAVYA